MTQGAQSQCSDSLIGVGWGGRWERVSRGRGYTVYLWLLHIDMGQKITQYCKDIILPLKINKFVLKKTYRRKEKQKKKLTLNWDLGWDHRDINLPATASILRGPCLVR